MKRHVVLAQVLLAAVFLFLFLPQGGRAAPELPPEGWTGIYSRSDLESIPLKPDGQYILMNDIDLTGKAWPGLCSEDLPFSGVLDGNDHSIYGMTAENASSSACGLFNYLCGGRVKNLSLSGSSSGPLAGLLCGKISQGEISDCAVRGTVTASQWGGGVVGQISGEDVTVENCTAVCTVTGSSSGEDEIFLGGIAGGAYGADIRIASCESSGTLSFSGVAASVGGTVGVFDGAGILSDCGSESALSLSLSAGGCLGGIVGRGGRNSLSIDGCSFRADWTVSCASADLRAGGIVGLLSSCGDCAVRDCVSFGSLFVTAACASVGGIVGDQIAETENSSVLRCSSFLRLSAVADPLYVGGICGTNRGELGTATVENCHADGSITLSGALNGDPSRFSGGICGFNGGTGASVLSLCFSSCDVFAECPLADGAAVGMSAPFSETGTVSVTQCYYRAGLREGFASPVSGDQLSDPASYIGFDFQQIWRMDASFGIPFLRSAEISSSQPLAGDTDGNGRLTAYDARLLMQYLTSRVTLTDGQKSRGDINGDGVLNATDVSLILRGVS
ncbi:MAG: dockerin type I repeat-containing protein [Clostridia bacterium]|nr:dockerin type I repeat-containing protein [Clostridia bacterium]